MIVAHALDKAHANKAATVFSISPPCTTLIRGWLWFLNVPRPRPILQATRVAHREKPVGLEAPQALLHANATHLGDRHDPVRPPRRPLDAREAQDRGRDPERGLRDLEAKPRRGSGEEDDCRVRATLGDRAGARLRRRGAGRA